MEVGDLTREELRLAMSRAEPITLAKALAVNDIIIKAKRNRPGFEWVRPHTRNGHPVGGFWRVDPNFGKPLKWRPLPPEPVDTTTPMSATERSRAGGIPSSMTPKQKRSRVRSVARQISSAQKKVNVTTNPKIVPKAKSSKKSDVDALAFRRKRQAQEFALLDQQDDSRIAALEDKLSQMKTGRGVPVVDQKTGNVTYSTDKKLVAQRKKNIREEVDRLRGRVKLRQTILASHAKTDRSPSDVRSPERRKLDRELIRRKYGTTKATRSASPLLDSYLKPPGSDDASQRQFKSDMFQSLLESPVEIGGKRHSSLSSYMSRRVRIDTGTGNYMVNPEDAFGDAIATVYGMWESGEIAPRVFGVSSKEAPKVRKQMKSALQSRYPSFPESKIDSMVEARTPIRPDSMTIDQEKEFVTTNLARVVIGVYKTTKKSGRVRAKSEGLVGAARRSAAGGPTLMERLETLQGFDWMTTPDGQRFLESEQIRPFEAALTVALAAVKTGNTRSKRVHRAIMTAMSQALVGTAVVNVPDPYDSSRERRVEVDLNTAILGDTVLVFHDGGAIELKPLSYNEAASVLLSAFTAKTNRSISNFSDQDAPFTYDDVAIAQLMGLIDDPSKMTTAQINTAKANVRKMRSRAIAKIEERVKAQGMANIIREREARRTMERPTIDELEVRRALQEKSKFQDSLRSVINYIAASEGFSVGVDTVAGIKDGSLPLDDVIADYTNLLNRDLDRRFSAPPVIELSYPERTPTPPLTARQRVAAKEDATRRAARSKLQQLQRQYETDVRMYEQWSSQVDDLKQRIANSEAYLKANPNARRDIYWNKKNKPVTRPSEAVNRLNNMKSKLAELRSKPVKKPVPPKPSDVGGIPIHVTEVEIKPRAKIVRPNIKPANKKRKPVSQAAQRQMRIAAEELQARRAKEKEAAQKKADKERRARLRRSFKLKATLDGAKTTISVDEQTEGFFILTVRNASNRTLYRQRFDEAVLGTGKGRSAAIARAEEIKNSKVVPVDPFVD